MKENNRNAIIKLYVRDELKAKLKATASLNNMTFTDLFIDAVFEKYPYLATKDNESKEGLQKQLAEILQQLAHSAEMSEQERAELKERKHRIKEMLRKMTFIKSIESNKTNI